MNTQPVFLHVGLNHPQKAKPHRRDLAIWLLAILLVGQTILIGALYYALQRAWKNEQAASQIIQLLHQTK